MNRKGFTLIELLTSLTLTSVVCILLFQVIFTLKDIYTNDSVKTELLIKTANVIESINSTFKNTAISTIRNCESVSNNCLLFTLVDGAQYELKLDRDNKTIKFGDFSTTLTGSSIIYDDLDVCYYAPLNTNSKYDTFIKIRIPIKDTLLEENFDVLAIYQYKSNNDTAYLYKDNYNGATMTYIPAC